MEEISGYLDHITIGDDIKAVVGGGGDERGEDSDGDGDEYRLGSLNHHNKTFIDIGRNDQVLLGRK